MKPGEICVVLVTVKNKRQGRKIARALLENKLATCINFVDAVDSMYWWDGKIVSDKEVMLLIKTRKALFSHLETMVRALHSYAVPEIIALGMIAGHKPYLQWISDSLDSEQSLG